MAESWNQVVFWVYYHWNFSKLQQMADTERKSLVENAAVAVAVEQLNHESIDVVLYELPNSTFTKPCNYNSTECIFLLVRDK